MKKKNAPKMTLSSQKEITLQEGFNIFYSFKQSEDIAKETLDYYSRSFSYFCKYFDKNMLCKEIGEETIIDYRMELLKNGNINTVTRNNKLRGIRAIFYYLQRKKYMPDFEVTLLPEGETAIELYTQDELEKLLKKPNFEKSTFAEYRNWVIVCFLMATGARAKSVCNLKLGDLDFNNTLITLRATKNRNDVIIPMSGQIKIIIKEYLEHRGGTDDDYLFVTIWGEALDRNTLGDAIERFNLSRGVSKSGIHRFRHNFATAFLLNGGSKEKLKVILGHKTDVMVNRYVHITGVDIMEEFMSACPLESFKVTKSATLKLSSKK